MKRILNFIDGQNLPPRSRNFQPNYAPATGQVYSEYPDSSVEDIDDAVAAARKAFPLWSRKSPEERSRILRRLGDLLLAKSEELAREESVDAGKPLALTRNLDIPRSARNFHFFADAITQFSSEAHETVPNALNYTVHHPLGVVGLISPWNLPLYLLTWKIAPALATGNCVVAKPSELTPMTAYLLGSLSLEAGLPPGVLNIVQGTGIKAGEAMTTHPGLAAISFTGGTRTGSHIASRAAGSFKKLSLELGGKNPNIIFADCDFDRMMETTLRSSFANQGQICLSGSRIFIERKIYQAFKEAFLPKVRSLRLGDPLDPQTEMGALISEGHREKILSYCSLARQEGGKILTGGEPAVLKGELEKGWFVHPTVIENLSPDSRTNQEEIFGPVVTLTPFDSEEEVLAAANGTPYGLSATLWTSNLGRAHRMSHELQCGMVWVNCWMVRDLRTPFGGTKQSGMGREGGLSSLRFFTEPKNVCIQY